MKTKHIFSDLEKAILFGLVFSVLVSFARFNSSCDTLRRNLLRIHIIANSDSKSDQAIKYKVRDAILKESKTVFEGCDSLAMSEKAAKKNIELFTKTANDVLKNKDYTATARIGKSYFNTREYKDFSLPAGYYDSLIITLGKGRGHNFWCVIYPTVCIGGSKAKLRDTVGKDSEVAENYKKYKVKFKSVEIYEKCKRKIKGKLR